MFWPQVKVNGTWSAQPVNLVNMANMIPSKMPKFIQKILEKTGLCNYYLMQGMILYLKSLVKVFSIPADNDDSSVNLALLGFMK